MNKKEADGLREILTKKGLPILGNDHKPVDRETWVAEFCEWIATARLDDIHLSEIYLATGKRLRSAVCHVCQQLKPRVGGILVYPGGDLSRPKVFVCVDCAEGLK